MLQFYSALIVLYVIACCMSGWAPTPRRAQASCSRHFFNEAWSRSGTGYEVVWRVELTRKSQERTSHMYAHRVQQEDQSKRRMIFFCFFHTTRKRVQWPAGHYTAQSLQVTPNVRNVELTD